jgi:hypothetical protein
MMQALRGKITFEDVDPQDLIDVAGSISGRESEGIFVDAPGSGVDRLLAWSLADLQLAVDAPGGAAREQCAANAIVNGRRALACLVDWYLARDCFSLCKDAPLPEKKQAELLLERRLIDDLSSRVLGRAIQTRNVVEHEYSVPTLEVAEDVVELLRRTIQCLRAESDPAQGPCLFGSLSRSVRFGAAGSRAEFYGWREPSFLLCSFDLRPWLGAIVPSSSNESLVRRTFFDEISTKLLLEVLQVLENNFGRAGGTMSKDLWRLVATECGLIETGGTPA